VIVVDETELERSIHTGRRHSLHWGGVLRNIRFGRIATVGRAQGRTRSTNGRGRFDPNNIIIKAQNIPRTAYSKNSLF